MGTATPPPAPLILTDASLTINGAELACVMTHIELTPTTKITTLDTMCGTREYPGSVSWVLNATLVQSFDTGATEDTLSGAVTAYQTDGTLAPFVVTGYKSRPAGPDNPTWSGNLIPQDYPPINGDAGNASEIQIAWSCDAPPVKAVTLAATSGSGSAKAAAA
jgi:hypothetical protein